MKKRTYYLVCVLIWIASVLLLAFLYVQLTFKDGIEYFGWGYALGTGCGHPQIWLIALGVVFSLRKWLYRSIVEEEKNFSKWSPVVMIIVGLIWLALNTASMNRKVRIQKGLYRYMNKSEMTY